MSWRGAGELSSLICQLVDEEAVRAALRTGRLGDAALNVFIDEPTDPELWRDVPNTILTPHLAGTSKEQAAIMTEGVIANVDRFFARLPLVTPIN
jgi:phosphoglycerate dehydrogenase-like enzyme